MEKGIILEIAQIMATKVENIKDLQRFNQGMSNYTFKFKVENKSYVYRKIGLDAELFVDYKKEYESLKSAALSGITSKVIYFDEKTGTKIQEYIPGEAFDFNNINENKAELIKTLKKLHSIKNENLSNYDLIKRLNKYESYVDKKHISKDYYLLKDFFIKTYNKYFINNELVFCHNDLQTINIINSFGKIYLIDFEYAGLNDIYYDFATFEENANLVFELYYNRNIKAIEIAKINFYKLFSSIQWYLVATHKEIVGFSKLTNYDFKELANYFINKANSLYEKIKEVDFSETSWYFKFK